MLLDVRMSEALRHHTITPPFTKTSQQLSSPQMDGRGLAFYLFTARVLFISMERTGVINSKLCRMEHHPRRQAPESTAKKSLRLQFNSQQSSTVDTSRPFSARHFEYSIEYSTYIPYRQTAIGWLTVDSGACEAVSWSPRFGDAGKGAGGGAVGHIYCQILGELSRSVKLRMRHTKPISCSRGIQCSSHRGFG
eukprot:8491850-Pyramimonas_sp.AAC.2